MTVVFAVLLIVAVVLVGLHKFKTWPALADPEPLQPRNVRTITRAVHPANELSDDAVDRLLDAMKETP